MQYYFIFFIFLLYSHLYWIFITFTSNWKNTLRPRIAFMSLRSCLFWFWRNWLTWTKGLVVDHRDLNSPVTCKTSWNDNFFEFKFQIGHLMKQESITLLFLSCLFLFYISFSYFCSSFGNQFLIINGLFWRWRMRYWELINFRKSYF